MIDKETAIELAKQAGGLLTEFVINCTKGMRFHNLDALTSLCNLAVAHAQKDAEPVAWMSKDKEDLSWGKSKYFSAPLYTHPVHDDTALLRQALEALELESMEYTVHAITGKGPEHLESATTALRERLGEVKP